MNENRTQIQAAGTRMIDAEDFAWRLASITSSDVSAYIATHEESQLVPISLVLALLNKAQ